MSLVNILHGNMETSVCPVLLVEIYSDFDSVKKLSLLQHPNPTYNCTPATLIDHNINVICSYHN